jgi:cellulose synthase/poly-beta-1,6-N-acetylglucosamine synthase-like glycosyltransferase
METIFWILFYLIIYHYLFFPILTIFFAFFAKRPVKTGDVLPSVSLVIAAYNEEKIIEKKIWNSLELDYPRNKLEIIIVSDGSTDKTPQIVEGFKSRGIVGIYRPPRKGKTAALNKAVAAAQCEIVVFSDANSIYEPQTIKMLVRNFQDSSVGGVCGRKNIIGNLNRESSRGDRLFWDFESRMKVLQSRIGSITTGDGEVFAVRKALYQEIPVEIINDDMAITLNIIQKGYRVIYEPEAISDEEASVVIEDDFNVKARMVAGGYQILAYYHKILFPPRDFFTIQFFSHKVLRWIMPILLVLLYITNLFLLRGFFLYFMAGQSLFYLAGLIGYAQRRSEQSTRIFYIPLYYCSMNAAALVGFYYFIAKRAGTTIWKKAKR